MACMDKDLLAKAQLDCEDKLNGDVYKCLLAMVGIATGNPNVPLGLYVLCLKAAGIDADACYGKAWRDAQKCRVFDGESCCADKCVNKNGDPRNCGSCGNVCSDGQKCVNGVCSDDCPSGLKRCRVAASGFDACIPVADECCRTYSLIGIYHCSPQVGPCCNGGCCPGECRPNAVGTGESCFQN